MHYACINVYFLRFIWSSLSLANVNSGGPCLFFLLSREDRNYYKNLEYTRFWPKKYRLCSHKQYFSVERLLFARRRERTFGGNPPQRAEYNEACRGRGVPKLLQIIQICKFMCDFLHMSKKSSNFAPEIARGNKNERAVHIQSIFCGKS